MGDCSVTSPASTARNATYVVISLVSEAGYQRAKGFSLSITWPVWESNRRDGPALADAVASANSPRVAIPRESMRRIDEPAFGRRPSSRDYGIKMNETRDPALSTGARIVSCYLAYVTPRW